MHYRCGWKCILADYILISKSSVCFYSLFCTDKKLGSCQYCLFRLTPWCDVTTQTLKIHVFTAKYKKL